jgi:hypothetical protein
MVSNRVFDHQCPLIFEAMPLYDDRPVKSMGCNKVPPRYAV